MTDSHINNYVICYSKLANIRSLELVLQEQWSQRIKMQNCCTFNETKKQKLFLRPISSTFTNIYCKKHHTGIFNMSQNSGIYGNGSISLIAMVTRWLAAQQVVAWPSNTCMVVSMPYLCGMSQAYPPAFCHPGLCYYQQLTGYF